MSDANPDTLVILNPKAGSGKDVPVLRERLGSMSGVEIRETEDEGHARKMAAQAVRDGIGTVVSAGGDGTLNEVLNGLAENLSAVRLGLLPLGTGNDFARTIGIPEDPAGAVELLRRGETRNLDVVRVTFGDGVDVSRLFLNMSVGGFAKAVNDAMDPEMKERWGALAYARSAADAFSELSAYRTRLVIDDDEVLEMELYLLVVANARFVASGIPAAPRADPEDGRFDVVAFPEMDLGRIAGMLPRTLLGRHQDHEEILSRRARRLEVTSDPPMPFNADGEQCGRTPVTFELLPGALSVVVGPREERELAEDEQTALPES